VAAVPSGLSLTAWEKQMWFSRCLPVVVFLHRVKLPSVHGTWCRAVNVLRLRHAYGYSPSPATAALRCGFEFCYRGLEHTPRDFYIDLSSSSSS
jgi:hypothetical protein